MSQRPTSASAKRPFFAVVCQPHQGRPPLVFKIKDPGSCNFPPRGLYPFTGTPTSTARPQAWDQTERPAVSRGAVVELSAGLWAQGETGPEAARAELREAGACSRGFTKHRNSGPCLCASPFRISCHSARAYIQLSVASVTANPGFAIFPV